MIFSCTVFFSSFGSSKLWIFIRIRICIWIRIYLKCSICILIRVRIQWIRIRNTGTDSFCFVHTVMFVTHAFYCAWISSWDMLDMKAESCSNTSLHWQHPPNHLPKINSIEQVSHTCFSFWDLVATVLGTRTTSCLANHCSSKIVNELALSFKNIRVWRYFVRRPFFRLQAADGGLHACGKPARCCTVQAGALPTC
jgi:hypothetical protein